MSYWGLVGSMLKGSASAASTVGQGINSLIQAQRVKPSARSLRRGILVFGDGPPTGVRGSFLDYREVLLPQHVQGLQQGVFPLGRVQDPGEDRPGFPVFLDWGYVARHVAVIGPTRSGKTYNVIAPWVVCACLQGLATVAVDTKGDLQAEIRAAKARLGVSAPLPTAVWDVDRPRESKPWNPLSEITTPTHAAQVAMAFLGEIDPHDHQKFFAERDHRWLRGLLWLAVEALGRQTHPSALFKMIVSQPWLSQLIRQAPHASHELLDLVQHSPSDYAKVTAGLANRLSWLAEPGLAAMLDGSGSNSFRLEDALNAGVLLIIGAQSRGGERSAAAAAIFLNLLRMKCLERFGGNPVPVFWILDEAARYAHRIQLEQMLDMLAGAHSPVCVALQDVNQLGPPEQQTRMLANCDTFITLAGVSPDTARFFSTRLGTVTAPMTTTAQDHTGTWRPSITHQDRPLLGDREIMSPPVGQYGGVAQLRSGSPHPFLFSFQ